MVLILLREKKKPEKDPLEETYSLGRQFEECLNRQANLERKILNMPDSPDKDWAKKQLKLAGESQEKLRARMYACINSF